MVPFGGFLMPVQYKESLINSHLHTRNSASLFDVSHMLQCTVHGRDRHQLIEGTTVADVQALRDGAGCLTLFTNDEGGIKDDLIVTNTAERTLHVVSNAGCREKDMKTMTDKESELKADGKDVCLEIMTGKSLLALQGPMAASVLCNFARLPFMCSVSDATVLGVDGCRVTRCGYTGEDGFEISVESGRVVELASKLLLHDRVWLAGLGARDSLRLEAGLCLYGNDIDEDVTPVEAGLTWCIGKRRRKIGDFPGSSVILRQLKDKPARKRVGLETAGAPARPGNPIRHDGVRVGVVTSGSPSPSLRKNIAMGYVPSRLARPGTVMDLEIRNRSQECRVVKMPFVATNYYS